MTRDTLREWRTSRRMSQVEAAEFFGVSRQAWQHWERGTREIPDLLETLIYLMETYAPVKRAIERVNRIRASGQEVVSVKPVARSRIIIAG
jgi:transcriptional regulator with XRE-family HTH domain